MAAELESVTDSAADEPTVPDAFSVHDAATANWLVRKIVEARQYAEHVRGWAASEIRRAERDEQFFLFRYGRQLEEWARAELTRRGGQRRSIGLPGGTVGFRHEHPHLRVVDEAELLAWCRGNLLTAMAIEIKATGQNAEALRSWHREHGDRSRLTESIAKSVLDQHVRDTGECPDGAEIASGDKFYVK